MRRRLLVENKPISSYKPYADICLVNNSTLDKLIVDGEEYSLDIYPSEQYTPIGVVVVPSSHTDDGTARVISLASMDYNNPDNGNFNENIRMFWGPYSLSGDIPNLKNCQYYPKISLDTGGTFEDTQRIIEWDDYGYDLLPSDYYFGTSYEGATNPYDTATCWGSGAYNSDWGCPSPYLNDGSKNPLYSQVYDDGSGIGNRTEQMDGRVNTAAILAIDNVGSTAWQTATTIQNTTNDLHTHPAAQCCWRYHTIGTNQGDWYLPTAGELGYLAARFKTIISSINKIVNLGFEAIKFSLPINFLTSTEYDTLDMLYFGFYSYSGYSHISNNKKNYELYVKAFLAV